MAKRKGWASFQTQRWIVENPGIGTNTKIVANQLGIHTRTLGINLGILERTGRIRREICEEYHKAKSTGDERRAEELGVWSYFPTEKASEEVRRRLRDLEQVRKPREAEEEGAPAKEGTQPGLRRELDEEFIDLVQRFARNFFVRTMGRDPDSAFSPPWDHNDLAGEMLLLLAEMARRGKLYERTTKEFLRHKALDATRLLDKKYRDGPGYKTRKKMEEEEESSMAGRDILVKRDNHLRMWRRVHTGTDEFDRDEGNGNFGMSIDSLAFFDRTRESGREDVSLIEMLEETQEAVKPADFLRKAFEDQGCLWTKDFHQLLEDFLSKRQGDKARSYYSAEHGPESRPAKRHTTILRSYDAAVVRWVKQNEGCNPTQGQMAEELGMARETLTRKLKKLVGEGRVRREQVREDWNPNNSKHTGRWRFFLGKKEATPTAQEAQGSESTVG